MKTVDCDFAQHGEQILAIINEAIAETTWLYDYAPRTLEQLAGQLEQRRAGGFPAIVAEGDDGELLGFATFGPYRELAGYKYTVEHSLFVAAHARRKGVGKVLLSRLIDIARAMDLHVLIGAIDQSNLPSIALHEALGFEYCGALREVGYKHGQWLDALFYQYNLETPAEPTEEQ